MAGRLQRVCVQTFFETLTPGTYAHGRTGGATLHKWLQDKNYAHTDKDNTDANEVERQMERLMKDPDVIAKDLDAAIKELRNARASWRRSGP